MPIILITAPCHPLFKTYLVQQGYEVYDEPSIEYAGVEALIGHIEGLVITTRIKVDKALLDKTATLKWIGRLGSGMELVDVAYATQKRIVCISTPEGNAEAVGEHAVGMLLSLMRRLSKSASEVKANQWLREANRGEEIQNKAVGIIGYGNTGMAFARCIAGFSPRAILAYDKYKRQFEQGCVKEVSMDVLYKEADIVSLHLPLTTETKHFVNKDFVQRFQKPFYLLNTSRGGIVYTPSLLPYLQNGKLKGVGLDVLENEKLETYTKPEQEELQNLLRMPNVLITPHIAGYSVESFEKMARLLIQKLISAKLL